MALWSGASAQYDRLGSSEENSILEHDRCTTTIFKTALGILEECRKFSKDGYVDGTK